MVLESVLERLVFWRPKAQEEEVLAAWIFAHEHFGRYFSDLKGIVDVSSTFEKQVRDARKEVYGLAGGVNVTRGNSIVCTWNDTNVEVEYRIHIQTTSIWEKIIPYSTIEIRQRKLDEKKAKMFLQEVLKYGVIVAGVEHGSYMISRKRNGKIINVTDGINLDTKPLIQVCDYNSQNGQWYLKKKE